MRDAVCGVARNSPIPDRARSLDYQRQAELWVGSSAQLPGAQRYTSGWRLATGGRALHSIVLLFRREASFRLDTMEDTADPHARYLRRMLL